MFHPLSGPAGAGDSQPFEMTDVHDKKTRSFTQLEIMCFCSEVGDDGLMKFLTGFNMLRIRSKDTKPELLVRKFLFGLKDLL